MDSKETALPTLAAMEENVHTRENADAKGVIGGKGMDLGDKPTRSMVERGSEPPESGPAKERVGASRAVNTTAGVIPPSTRCVTHPK